MRYCAVLNCKNNSDKPLSDSDRVSFHLFPKDPETKQAWIYATGRINWTPRKYSTICSEHFTDYDFMMKNGKKFLRSTTVPRFNLNEQNSRYTEAEYHNETDAALQFLTGQIFPETDIPVNQEAEVVTVQVIGGNNPKVVVKKPANEAPTGQQQRQDQPNPPEKKPKYFSIVNCFKSEAELKAEKDKIHELIRDNLDPSISKILLSLEEKPVKKKKKKNGENSPQQGNNMPDKPRGKNGQFLKLPKKKLSIQGTSSEGHYTDNLTREEIIHKLKQRDQRISQQQITIRDLQKTHLRDQVEIESLRIKLKLKNNETAEETTNEPIVQTPETSHSDASFNKPAHQQIVTSKRQTNTENYYQSTRNFSDQNQTYFDTQNRHSNIGLKKPARQQIVTQKRQRMETTNTINDDQSNTYFSDEDQTYFGTQNRHSNIGLKKPARQQIVTQKRQRMETTNTINDDQSNTYFSDEDQTYFGTQNRHSNIGLKKPARQQIVTQKKRQRLETTNTENYQSNNISDQAYRETQNRHSDVGLNIPAGRKIVIPKQKTLVFTNTENRNQSNMIFSDQDRTHFWNF